MKKLTQVESIAGYRKTSRNALHLLEAAEKTKTINYGLANSLLILSAEEAVKALMLFSGKFDPESTEEDFDLFFRDHKFKHKTIKSVELWKNLMTTMLDVQFEPIVKLIQKAEQEESEPTEEEMLEAKKVGTDKLVLFLREANKNDKTASLSPNDKWWNAANQSKNNGLYVGYDKGVKKWKTPQDVAEEIYIKSYSIVEPFVKMMSSVETQSESLIGQELINSYLEGKGKLK